MKTVLESSDPEVEFDEHGISDKYYEFQRRSKEELCVGEAGRQKAHQIAEDIKRETRGKDYDCLIGLSGGVDSSYVAYLVVKELGLRPLAIHLDNGWNSELAVSNIEKIVNTLKIDLHTEVLDWEEFRELQKAFFRASVGNVEAPTDHAINATLFQQAKRFGIRHIISGSNLNSEGIVLFGGWGHDNKDWANIRDINKKFGTRSLKTFPHFTLLSLAMTVFVRRIKFLPILNYFDFHKEQTIELLERELGWRRYERKHGESLFTRFFQEYYLPEKFGVDKRRSHLSSLICSGQVTREDALEELKKPLFAAGEKEELIEFVCKKLEFSPAEWEAIMKAPPVRHSEYRTNKLLSAQENKFYQLGRKIATGR